MKIKILYIVFPLLILLGGCQGCREEADKIVSFEADYSNPTGNNPSIQVDNASIDPIIQMDPSLSTATVINNRALISIPNVQLKDETTVYQISTIVTEEFSDSRWVKDVENFLKQDVNRPLDLVMVIDVSSSLAQDVASVKTSAINLISSLAAQSTNFRVGVVGFSDMRWEYPISTNIEGAKTFIQGLPEDRNATQLYESMYAGSQMFQDTSVARAMVTFTDGRNNSQTSIQFENSDYLYSQLSVVQGLRSYVIGAGDVDKTILKKLAVGGSAEFSTDTKSVNQMFDKMKRNLTSIYTLTYDRNASPVSTRRLKFSFTILAN